VSSVVDLISGSTVSEHTSDLQQVARDFARQQLAPHGAVWDKEEIFPVDVLKQAAELGFAGLFVDEQYGGCGLSRSDGKAKCKWCVKHAAAQGHQPRQCAPAGVVIFEALSYGDVPTTAYLTIHNMVAGVLNRWGRHAQHDVLDKQQQQQQQQQTKSSSTNGREASATACGLRAAWMMHMAAGGLVHRWWHLSACISPPPP
jgi:alkylation response protein AidB-like acyl-CoA dehydrogenase